MKHCLILINALVLWSNLSFAGEIKAVVNNVYDGDTIVVSKITDLGNNQKIKLHPTERIRIWGIDCPEKIQDFGSEAKQFTISHVLWKDVVIEIYARDKYHRILGQVFYNKDDLGLALINAGLAWALTKEYRYYQDQAKGLKIGLWVNPNPISPWEFRHGIRK